MSDIQTTVLDIFQGLLQRANKEASDLSLDVRIHGDDGLGLDSLETAELSALLEDEFGTDPFGAGLMPETIGEIINYYPTAGNGESATA